MPNPDWPNFNKNGKFKKFAKKMKVPKKMATDWRRQIMKPKQKWKDAPKCAKFNARPKFKGFKADKVKPRTKTEKAVFSPTTKVAVIAPFGHVSREVRPLTRSPTPKPRSIKKKHRVADNVKKMAVKSLKSDGKEVQKIRNKKEWLKAAAKVDQLEKFKKIVNKHPRELAIQRGHTKINIAKNDQKVLVNVKKEGDKAYERK